MGKIPNGRAIYKNFPSQGLPKNTKIGIFGVKKYTTWQPGTELDSCLADLLECRGVRKVFQFFPTTLFLNTGAYVGITYIRKLRNLELSYLQDLQTPVTHRTSLYGHWSSTVSFSLMISAA
jgi:hypothetical protein